MDPPWTIGRYPGGTGGAGQPGRRCLSGLQRAVDRPHPGGTGRPGQPQKRCHLGNNELSGAIPAELGGLANLEGLSLYDNELSGPIPAKLGGLANLEWLYLGSNELTGTIPAELGGLANLQDLNLGRNQLSGPIPAELGGLGNLGTRWIFANQLSGTIPPELGNLANVWQMSLVSNELSGPIPPELGGLANLDMAGSRVQPVFGNRAVELPATPRSCREFRFQEKCRSLPSDGPSSPGTRAIEEREGPVCPDAEVLRALYEAAGRGRLDERRWVAWGRSSRPVVRGGRRCVGPRVYRGP